MAAAHTDQGVLRKGRGGLPSGCKIDLLWGITDSNRSIAIFEVCGTNKGVTVLREVESGQAA